MRLAIFTQHPLSADAERRLIHQHEQGLAELLPILGPLFGLGVVLFSFWDYLIDADHAWTALLVRVTLVLLGSIAYFSTRLKWTPTQRCGYIYWTHASAVVLCEFLLERGILHGLAGITACLFILCVIALRIRTFLLIFSVPAILFVALVIIKFPTTESINALVLYFFCACLAFILMMVVRFLRRESFLLQEQILQLSRQDSLTGAHGRAYLAELAEHEIAIARRHQRPLAAAMLDIDHFKHVNDTYGHDIGDQVIRQLADSCRETLRHIDHFGRVGGEEFACILPETSAADAMTCAERLRRNIEALRIQTPSGPIQITISIGVAMFNPETHNDWHALLKESDEAMYRAKREGRNRVVMK